MYTVKHHMTTEIRSEKCVVRRFFVIVRTSQSVLTQT